MLKVYGTKTCPDCRECKINFDRNGVAYEYVDLNASLANLKEFLRLRDRLPVFDGCKEHRDPGAPVRGRLRHPGLGRLPDGTGPAGRLQGARRPGLQHRRHRLLRED